MNQKTFKTFIFIVIFIVLIILTFATFKLSLRKNFAIDEFQYAHASWLINKGDLPYRDFFEVHFPFIYQLASIYWIFMDDNPANIIYLRTLMLLLLGVCIISISYLSSLNKGLTIGLLGAVLALGCINFSIFAVELRPDPLGLTFYLLAIASLYISWLNKNWKGFLSGLFLIATFWSTQKAFMYGIPFFAAFLFD